MLEIRKITKKYKTGDFTQKALNGVSVNFRECEFVSILGPSGSGKTTLLNIIGGLDKYTSGDLVINGISTKKYKDKDWDAYRNHRIGFVFQSYNLIPHQTILSNVELALTLSGVSKKERRRKAKSVLKKVGLEDHINKKPNQLSGGQMQRVAIARALINDPDILLADEPTGALDSATSVQIMKLLKEISEEKLVIMVTHNPDIANEYSTRIIRLKDGEITGDTDPYLPELEEQELKTTKSKKTSMSFLTALKLSFNNIKTKKGRTLLTAFASSIGIIGIALILSLSNGFNLQIKKYEKGIMSAMPVIISEQSMNLNSDTMKELSGESYEKYPNIDYVIAKKPEVETLVRINKITKEYVDYLEAMPKEYSYGIAYNRYMKLNVIKELDDNYKFVDITNIPVGTIPKSFDKDKPNAVIEAYYDLLAGRLPENDREMILIVTATNQVTDDILDLLGLSKEGNISFDDILNSSIHVVLNDDMYIENNGNFVTNTDMEDLYNKSIELKVVGIIRMNEDFPSYVQNAALTYTEEFADYLIENNSKSKIVKLQEELDFNLLTGLQFGEETDTMSITKEMILAYLGDDSVPYNIMLYPKDFDSKKDLLKYLDKYNENLSEEDKIIYTDQAAMISSMSGSIMDAVTIVLIAFSSISLIVSCIMIGIITYISVLERTKEIGILRALGARKKDISRVFNAETFIIGVTSGLIGIFIAFLLTIPANMIIYKLSELPDVAKLNPVHAIILIIISTTLTMIGGLIPARVASKKDPVIALRTE